MPGEEVDDQQRFSFCCSHFIAAFFFYIRRKSSALVDGSEFRHLDDFQHFFFQRNKNALAATTTKSRFTFVNMETKGNETKHKLAADRLLTG